MKGEHTEQSPKAERRLPLVRIRLDEARSRTRDLEFGRMRALLASEQIGSIHVCTFTNDGVAYL